MIDVFLGFRKTALVLLLCALAGVAIAQENCVNGIDDDSDGLIDLNDPDCSCYTVALDTLFGDFEDMSCCPNSWTGPLGIGVECLEGWSPANLASPDYMHECDYLGGDLVPSVPLPMPSGQGAIGLVTLDTLDVWSEFIGLCMPSIMLAGETYTVEMYVGFNEEFIYTSSSPFTIAIFGTTSCDNYPAATEGCVEALSEWTELATQDVTGADDSWSYTTFSFTPSQDIAAIAIGGACVELNGILEYHFVDDIKIYGDFGGNGIEVDEIVESGDCISGVEVNITEISGATYQWYLDGVAITGATSSTYIVPAGGDGEYIVVVDNGVECGESEPLDVTVETNVLDIDGIATDVDCFGSATGEVDIDLPADNPPFAILWGTGQMTEDITNLLPGAYSVTVTDDNGCFGVETFFVTQPDDVLMVQVINVVQPVGAGSLGSAEVSTMGGTPDYAYLWDNGETTEIATLEPGIHFVTITDANGCEEILQVLIHEPLVVATEIFEITCYDGCDGSIELTVTGGLIDYTFEWDDGSANPINTSLCAGIYFVTITDNAGTVIIDNYEVLSPEEIIINGDYTDMTCSDANGWIELDVTGGMPGYSYIWSNGETVENIYDLPLDQYTVTVTDQNGCTQTETFLIDILDPLNITGAVTQESCGGGGDGAIDINIEFGIAPFTYAWSNGLDIEDLDGLVSGIYEITVTDNFGCSASESFIVSQGGSLNVMITSLDASCQGLSDGTISVTVVGGTPPYTYTWDNGANTPDLSDLAPGDYTLTIEDNGGCTWVDIITIGTAAGIEVVETITNATCWDSNDGEITLLVSGGTSPYIYSWSNGADTRDVQGLTSGGYTVTITGANGCMTEATLNVSAPTKIQLSGVAFSASCPGIDDGSGTAMASGGVGPYSYLWSTGDNVQTVTDLGPGDYVVTVTDANGCTADSTFTIDALEEIMITENITSASCNGGMDGAIDVTTTGGTTPYVFLWSTGQITEDLQDLSASIYTLSVTDANGCMQITQFEVFGAGSLSILDQITGITCFGDQDGAIELTVSGGIAPYEYEWSNGASSEDISGLDSGIYSVTITDAADCEFQADYVINAVDALSFLFDKEDILCNGEMTGFIRVIAAGGTSPFDYQWSSGQNNDTIQNLEAGDYGLTITDGNGCTVQGIITLTEPPPITISIISITNPAMVGEFGSAEIQASGGVAPYSINWENSETGIIAVNLEIGITNVEVTDANGCIATIPIEIKVEAFTVNFSVKNNLCFGECLGEITLDITAGLPPFAIDWSDGQSGLSAINLCEGTYSVTITDSQGDLVEFTSIDVISPPEFILNEASTGTTCIENNDGLASVNPTGGTPPYVYAWSTGSSQKDLVNLTPGQYTITATDANGCESSQVVDVTGIEALDVTIHSSDVDCNSSTGSIIISGENTLNYTYLVNGEPVLTIGDSLITGLDQGVYLVEYRVNTECVVEIGEVEIQGLSNFNIEVSPSFGEVFLGESIELAVTINGKIGNYAVTWMAEDSVECIEEDSLGHCVLVSATPQSDLEVSVIVTDDSGCEDIAIAVIKVKQDRQVFVPNVFSPNDDGVNDVFKPYASDHLTKVNSMRIYSRWGEEIYSASNLNFSEIFGWDGRYSDQLVSPGVYVYRIEVVHTDGEIEMLIGDVTVVR